MPLVGSSSIETPATTPGSGSPSTAAAYVVSAVACAALVAVPFVAVDIPPITDLPQQTVQIRLADMSRRITTAQLLSLRLGRIKDRGELKPAQVSLAKWNNCRAALDIARDARDILGGAGISAEYVPVRHMLNLDNVVAGVSPTGDDNIIFDIGDDGSAGGFGHPVCDDDAKGIAESLPDTHPIGPDA